jgi:hypothetical protein
MPDPFEIRDKVADMFNRALRPRHRKLVDIDEVMHTAIACFKDGRAMRYVVNDHRAAAMFARRSDGGIVAAVWRSRPKPKKPFVPKDIVDALDGRGPETIYSDVQAWADRAKGRYDGCGGIALFCADKMLAFIAEVETRKATEVLLESAGHGPKIPQWKNLADDHFFDAVGYAQARGQMVKDVGKSMSIPVRLLNVDWTSKIP